MATTSVIASSPTATTAATAAIVDSSKPTTTTTTTEASTTSPTSETKDYKYNAAIVLRPSRERGHADHGMLSLNFIHLQSLTLTY
jgi:hypothetical protein